ncbi:uncharacterized protein LOC129585235 [Paramacrobiotus metropolitanus]|uniref:uncharacterized protein LOC129585235 n=1 Tax=Paramacrobiotus metropolitanus TaxID=2943436 RepID=UPI0024461735|nr:uncharacterized protein LOC129585235 [Paramacrobiotus metropolitanus]
MVFIPRSVSRLSARSETSSVSGDQREVDALVQQWEHSENKAEAFEKVESALNRMSMKDADVIPAGAESDLDETPDMKEPGIPAEPGYPAVARGTQYVCFNCRKPEPGHTTSQCRRLNSRRFQPRDGERAKKFKKFLEDKERAMRQIEDDRKAEDAEIRAQRDDEIRAERNAREERYRREDRERTERRRREDRRWEDVWAEKLRVHRNIRF